MLAKNLTLFDGRWYQPGETIPDIGSFVATSVSGGNIRSYEGLSADISKLLNYDNDDLETGSSAFCVDTGQLLKYEKTTKTWYEL